MSSRPNRINPTPSLPKPPQGLIEAAAKAIPEILANVTIVSNLPPELKASTLVQHLRAAGHLLATAQWAICSSINEGRLRTAPLTFVLPSSGGHSAFGDLFAADRAPKRDSVARDVIPIELPTDKPTPFHCFKVVATEKLWRWWRALELESVETLPSGKTEKGQPMALPSSPSSSKLDEQCTIALVRVYTNGVLDDRIESATKVLANDQLTANEKLTQIDDLIPIPAVASAGQLGGMLGVSKQAVLKTDWWKRNRRGEKENEIGRRRAKHQQRNQSFEPSDNLNDSERG